MLLATVDEVPEVLSRCLAEDGMMLDETEIDPAFFNLATRIAGELFQKVVNYGGRLAIVVADSSRYGARFSELIHEHQRHGNIRFFATADAAQHWLEASR